MGVAEQTEPADITSCDVLVVGAGFSGVYAIHKFRQLGLTVKAFEAGGDLGGVWHWNRYPGARVDSEWPYYQLRIPEVWKDFDFSERFPTHDEVRRYFAHADTILDLKKDIWFHTRVSSATWDDADSRWTVRTEGGHVAVCKYLCLCTGVLHRQHLPGFPGIEDFKGQIYHSAAWPDDVDVSGKRVGLVGAGATAVQIVQELSKQASHFTMFMRQPNICLPMNNRPINEKEHASWRTFFPLLFDAGRKSNSGFPVPPPTCGMFDLTDEARDEWYEQMWNAGAFHFVGGNFRDVSDGPIEPPYPIFTRRYPLEHDYYESLDRDNVDIVNLRQSPIKTFTETGVLTEDGAHELDYLILATGFDAFTGSVATMNAISKDGVSMKDVWKSGIRTYLGILVHGFPNCFLSYGPQSPTILSNGPTILECQIDFIADTIAKMEKEGLCSVEPTEQAEDQWKERISSISRWTLFVENDSWWTGASISRKKKELLVYIGGIPSYEKECQETLDGWKGFEIKIG
ncbi:hypothetical protein BJX99DRAFT_247982 [Aspergillus californicus]